MALVKRDDSPFWWLDIAVPKELQARLGKTRIRESTGITERAKAQRLHDKVRADMWNQQKLGIEPEMTLRQAVDRWFKRAQQRGMRDIKMTHFRLEWWVKKLGANRPVSQISRHELAAAVEGLTTVRRYRDHGPRPVSAATTNRYLQAMSALLNLCAGEWEVMRSAPKIPLLPEPRGRIRALTIDEMKRLISELPEHLRDVMLFALATGLRKSNVARLRWDQVDLTRARLLVGAEEFKNGEDFGLPLNDTALGVLARNLGRHPEAVFTFRGKPLGTVHHTTWRAALERAGIEDFRWHDLRHTWATMVVEQGVDIDTLQKLGGWKSRNVVMRYAHYRTEHLRGSSVVVDQVLGGLGGPDPVVVPLGTTQNSHAATNGERPLTAEAAPAAAPRMRLVR